jgi:hypothetical protein
MAVDNLINSRYEVPLIRRVHKVFGSSGQFFLSIFIATVLTNTVGSCQLCLLKLILLAFTPPASHLKVGMSRYVVMPKQARLLVPIAHQVLDMYAGILGSSSSIWHLVCSLSLNIFLHNSSFV